MLIVSGRCGIHSTITFNWATRRSLLTNRLRTGRARLAHTTTPRHTTLSSEVHLRLLHVQLLLHNFHAQSESLLLQFSQFLAYLQLQLKSANTMTARCFPLLMPEASLTDSMVQILLVKASSLGVNLSGS